MTIPKAYRVARTWCTPMLFVLLLCEIVFKLGDLEIPSILIQNVTIATGALAGSLPVMTEWTMILPYYITEYELITYFHWNIPCIILLAQCISVYCYIDPDVCCHNIIKGLLSQQQVSYMVC